MALQRGQHFASDNWAGIAPEALAALLQANACGQAPAYGGDAWTQRAIAMLRGLFECDCEVFFVFNGSAANALALSAICRPFEAVVCTPMAHIAVDECHAAAYFGHGVSLLPAADDSADAARGQLTSAALRAAATRRSDVHAPRVRAVSVTQATELGTVYDVDTLRALAATAHGLGLKVHMDGARFANAIAALGCSPADASWRAGVDVLSFGLTKNGAPLGEAVVFFERALADGFAWRVKQSGQLASKMRMLSAPWIGLLQDGAWLRHAAHANAMAQRLHRAIAPLPGVRPLHAPEANGLFVHLPRTAVAALHERGWQFHEVLPDRNGQAGCRLMCAWDTAPETVDAFAADLAAASSTAD